VALSKISSLIPPHLLIIYVSRFGDSDWALDLSCMSTTEALIFIYHATLRLAIVIEHWDVEHMKERGFCKGKETE
jgi:hypothetical protein